MQLPHPSERDITHQEAVPIGRINRKDFAERTGGVPTGDHLSFYGNDWFIDYVGGRLDFAIEGPWDEGRKPTLSIGSDSISLKDARVISSGNGAILVRAEDIPTRGYVHYGITTLEEGRISDIAHVMPFDNFDSIEDPRIKEAARVALVDSRRARAMEQVMRPDPFNKG